MRPPGNVGIDLRRYPITQFTPVVYIDLLNNSVAYSDDGDADITKKLNELYAARV